MNQACSTAAPSSVTTRTILEMKAIAATPRAPVRMSGENESSRSEGKPSRSKRVEEIEEMRTKSVAPTDLRSDMCAGADGEARDAAAAVRAGGGNGRTAERKTAGKGVERVAEAVDRRPFVFGRKKVGVARRPSAMVDAGGVGGAGAFGALASAEEEVAEEEEVDITFLPPKPRVKGRKEKTKEKAAVKAAADAAEEAAEGDSGAAKTAAVAAVATDGKLEDLEVLSIGSDPIDKTSEEAADKEKVAVAVENLVCPLVAAMVTTEEKNTKEIAAVTIVAAGRQGSSSNTRGDSNNSRKAAAGSEDETIRTEGMLEMRVVQLDRKKTAEKAEDKGDHERLRKSLVQS